MHPNTQLGDQLVDGSQREDVDDSLFSLTEEQFALRVRALAYPSAIPKLRPLFAATAVRKTE